MKNRTYWHSFHLSLFTLFLATIITQSLEPSQKTKKRISWAQELEQIKFIPSLKEQKEEELKFELIELHKKLAELHHQLLG